MTAGQLHVGMEHWEAVMSTMRAFDSGGYKRESLFCLLRGLSSISSSRDEHESGIFA